MFTLPNLVTFTSAFTGFYAILTLIGATPGDTAAFQHAAGLIALSLFLDGFDGPLARALNSQSEIGGQLDSLADALAFCVAPAALMYAWGLAPLGWGVFSALIAFSFAGLGLLRLARFNTRNAEEDAPPLFFVGMPTPPAAAIIISVVLVHIHFFGSTPPEWYTVVLPTTLVGVLMVSPFQLPTFKDVKLLSPTGLLIAATVIVMVVGIWITPVMAIPLIALALIYFFFGKFIKDRTMAVLESKALEQALELDDDLSSSDGKHDHP